MTDTTTRDAIAAAERAVDDLTLALSSEASWTELADAVGSLVRALVAMSESVTPPSPPRPGEVVIRSGGIARRGGPVPVRVAADGVVDPAGAAELREQLNARRTE